MKNLSNKFLYLLLSVFIFSSCTVEKRIHTKGYHVNWNNSKQEKIKNTQTASSNELNLENLETNLIIDENASKKTPTSLLKKEIKEVKINTDYNDVSASIASHNIEVENNVLNKTLDDYSYYNSSEINYEELLKTPKRKILPLKLLKKQEGGGDLSAFALAGFVCGILGLILLLAVGFPFFLGLLGTIFSAIGMRQTSNGQKGRGFAIAGLIISILVMLFVWMLIALIGAILLSI